MDFWPIDGRADRAKYEKKERVRVGFPSVDTGCIGAATLVQKGGRLDWTSHVDVIPEKKAYVRLGGSSVLVPPSRTASRPEHPVPLLRRAEEGANYMRNMFPDVDVTASLLRKELIEDYRRSKRLEEFDPSLGNLICRSFAGPLMPSDVLSVAFPGGETGSLLNIAEVKPGDSHSFGLCSIRSMAKLDTPIRQLSSCLSTGCGVPSLAVRTMGSTLLFDASSFTDKGSSVKPRAVISRSRTGDRPCVDIDITDGGLLAMVNDTGAVFLTDPNRSEELNPFSSTEASTDEGTLWKIFCVNNGNSCFRLSPLSVDLLDVRARVAQTVYKPFAISDRLTSIEKKKFTDQSFLMCSTERLVWIDQRVPRKPLLSLKHRLSHDMSLSSQTISVESGFLSFLTRRRCSLLTSYLLSEDNHGLARFHGAGSPLLPKSDFGNLNGQLLLDLDTSVSQRRLCLMQLSENGSLRASSISISSKQGYEFTAKSTLQSDTTLKTGTFSLGPSESDRDAVLTDFSSTYKRIFQLDEKIDSGLEEDRPDAIYDLIDQLDTFWQRYDDSWDCLLSTADIIVRLGDDPPVPSKSDFLAPRLTSSTRGFRASVRGRLSAKHLEKGSSWHCDLTPTLTSLGYDIQETIERIDETLHRFDLNPLPEIRTSTSFRREKEARQQLALDLELSKDVFSGRSLDSSQKRPFSFFNPLAKSTNAEVSDEDYHVDIPPAVGALLEGWELGSSSDENLIFDEALTEPTQVTGEVDQSVHFPSISALAPPRIAASQSFVPPPIVASQDFNPRRDLYTLRQSQPPEKINEDSYFKHQLSGSQAPYEFDDFPSQVPMISTQVMPGAYGGRPKVKKKRVGGF